MRLSADRNDPGFNPRYAKAKVFLDGVELDNCVTADEDLRACVVLDLEATGTQPRLKVIVGDVRIVFQ